MGAEGDLDDLSHFSRIRYEGERRVGEPHEWLNERIRGLYEVRRHRIEFGHQGAVELEVVGCHTELFVGFAQGGLGRREVQRVDPPAGK